MKAKTIIALLALCAMFSCSSNDEIESMPDPVSIEESLSYKVHGDGSTAIINSKGALQQTLPGGYEVFANKVDFSKNNLLLIYGTSNYGVAYIDKKQAKNDDKFYFEITVQQNMLCVMEPWCIAYVVPKGLNKSHVDIKIKYEK